MSETININALLFFLALLKYEQYESFTSTRNIVSITMT